MQTPTLTQALWTFLIYAFLGWCAEVAYHALRHGNFVNRGFLTGPVCPIYGFGVVLVVTLLTPLKGNLLLLFLGSMALTGALEFLTGFVLEKIFHDKWWDYSNEPFNIMGYVCLRFLIVWGLACTFVLDAIHPLVLTLIAWMPPSIGSVLLTVLLAVLAVDFVISALAASKLHARLKGIDELTKKMRTVSDAIGAPLAEEVVELKGKWEAEKPALEALKQKLEAEKPEPRAIREKLTALAMDSKRAERRLLKAFPRLMRQKFAESVELLQQHWEEQAP